jgi:hypothetical protein
LPGPVARPIGSQPLNDGVAGVSGPRVTAQAPWER